MEAAFKPDVNGELDTKNFLKFDEVWFYVDPQLISEINNASSRMLHKVFICLTRFPELIGSELCGFRKKYIP